MARQAALELQGMRPVFGSALVQSVPAFQVVETQVAGIQENAIPMVRDGPGDMAATRAEFGKGKSLADYQAGGIGGRSRGIEIELPLLHTYAKYETFAAKVKAPLLIHYAGLDERINKGWPAYEAALKAHSKRYAMHMYPGVNHGFHNDTTPRYDDAAAKLSWQRTLDFFNQHLRG